METLCDKVVVNPGLHQENIDATEMPEPMCARYIHPDKEQILSLNLSHGLMYRWYVPDLRNNITQFVMSLKFYVKTE